MNPVPQPTVLVIDDEASVRESLRNYLEDQLFTVFEAANGREGIERFLEHRPDAVLVDLRMPEMNGHQVLERLAQEAPDVPLIVTSGTGRIEDTIEALRLGAWDYLLKPVTDLGILSHAIGRALERARLLRENHAYQQHLEELVGQRTRELTEKIAEMERFHRMAVGRERRIIELKRQINTLLAELGREPQYKSPEMIEPDPELLD